MVRLGSVGCTAQFYLHWEGLSTPKIRGVGPGGEPIQKYPPPHTTPLRPGTRGAATARGALGWYRPSVGVPRDVGCCALVVFVAYIFSVQFSSPKITSLVASQRWASRSQELRGNWHSFLTMDLDYMQTLTLDTQVKAASSSIYFLKRVTSDKLEAQSGAATP